MNDPASSHDQSPDQTREAVLFGPKSSLLQGGNGRGEETERNWLPWIVAIIVIVLAAGLALLLGGHRGAPTGSTTSGIDPYAAKLAVSNIKLSQADNFAGGQLTYVDGTISNHGDRTVTSITVRVLFANDVGERPQVEQMPLRLIRTRQPYVDMEPVSASPLKPGTSQDFRLIFDDVSSMWNQQVPVVKVEGVGTRD